jgi:hypothetical protein
MTHKKFWEWFSDPLGNLITDRGRFSLLQVDEVDRLPIKDKLPNWLKNEVKEIKPVDVIEKPEILKPETFFTKLKRKYRVVIDLIVGVVDLFTKGAASKIQNAVDKLLENPEDKKVEQITIGDKPMFEAIKSFIVSKAVQWILKAAGGVLAGLGISSGTVEEVVVGAVVFILSAVWSLISTGKIALTDPKDFLKLK